MNRVTIAVLSVACWAATSVHGAEAPAMFGNTPSRNMVSEEKGLPTNFDIDSGENVLWKVKLGSQAYGGPVVHGGKVFAGTNNESPRNPKLTGDRGNLMAFDAKTGKFLWQSAHPKLTAGKVNDWPQQGVCSGPAVEGDRLYYVSNRAEIVAADTEGFLDGENDGAPGEANATEIDEDVVWRYDMIGELDVFPHNLAAGNPLLVDDLLYTVTGNGVDEGHINIPAPSAPSFIAVHKKTGYLVWESNLPQKDILHGQWSNPTYGVAGGRAQVVFPGGNGWLYSFEPKTGELLWKFDCNPKDSVWKLGGAGTRNNIIGTPVFHGDKVYVAVGQDPEHGEGIGHLYAIPATGSGDVTGKAAWHRGGEDFHRTISTVSVAEGIVYAADLSGFLYALDAETGQLYWRHDVQAAIWGSPFSADGKVYLGDEDGDLVVLRQGKTKEVLFEGNLGASIMTTPVASDGVLYVMARNTLFALKEGAKLAMEAPQP
jgi:outer membrane protein assembly factor BamB